jgi:glyceraldehyde 3-phosphate dehydrogenase
MALRVAINGFGRIGRQAFKIAFERDDIEIVVVNDITEPFVLAHLLRYDTNYGPYNRKVEIGGGKLVIDGKSIPVLALKVEPKDLPWKKFKVDVVLECTGRFTDAELAKGHLIAGAKKVVLSAPGKNEDATVILGVNEKDVSSGDIISNASCTTNCITPVAQVMVSEFGVEGAMMTTTHSYTAEQNLVDGPPPGLKGGDLRRARAAAENIIPTSTGATQATAKAIPELAGIFSGIAIRVPTSVVSLADFTFLLKKEASPSQINSAFKKAASSPRYKGILAVSNEPLVSSDFKGSTYSAIVDLPLTQTVGRLAKVFAWYDNEWGYSHRLVEEAVLVGKTIKK